MNRKWPHQLLGLALLFSQAAVATDQLDALRVATSRRDYASALKLARPLAEADNAEAQMALGTMYAGGLGVKQSNSDALNWFERSASLGNVKAQLILAAIYGDPLLGVSQDEGKALFWTRRAADGGEPRAQYLVAKMFDEGRGVPPNVQEAAGWYRKAADQNFAPAQYELGMMYSEGEYFPRDERAAVGWYRKAASQGHAGAQFNLAVAYRDGVGTPQDLVRAHIWFSLSASASTAEDGEKARKGRDTVSARMNPSQLQVAQEMASRCRSTGFKECY